MKTEISTDRTAAVELLLEGEIVALPTETVYGLAADALNPIAVAKIFEAKERPRFDPLIVHLPDREWLEKVVDLPAQHRQLILKLADTVWPGPFTMVLPKREIVPEIFRHATVRSLLIPEPGQRRSAQSEPHRSPSPSRHVQSSRPILRAQSRPCVWQ